MGSCARDFVEPFQLRRCINIQLRLDHVLRVVCSFQSHLGSWLDRPTDRPADQDYDDEHYQYHAHDQAGHPPLESEEQDYHDPYGQPRGPQIFLAQQQPGFDREAYLAVDSPRPMKKYLSTITELTERTEPSMLLRNRHQHLLVPNTPRSFVSSPTTSYGNELGKFHLGPPRRNLAQAKLIRRQNVHQRAGILPAS